MSDTLRNEPILTSEETKIDEREPKRHKKDGFVVPTVTKEMRDRTNERKKDAEILKIQAATTIDPGVICIETGRFLLEGNSVWHMLEVRKLSADGKRAVVYNAKKPTTTCVRTIELSKLVYCFPNLAAMNTE